MHTTPEHRPSSARATPVTHPTYVHLAWSPPLLEQLHGHIVVVIDVLRATSTIAYALAAGAASVVPCMEPEDARLALHSHPSSPAPLLGGERGGLPISGFDLGNSPGEYTPERVRGRTVIFSTTNGTRALLRAADAGANRILVGALANLSAIAAHLAGETRPVHLLCAGIHDRVCLDDTLAAGALLDALLQNGRELAGDSDDQPLIALDLFRHVGADAPRLARDLRRSQGGRNLAAIGLAADIDFCARFDAAPVIPAFNADRGTITI